MSDWFCNDRFEYPFWCKFYYLREPSSMVINPPMPPWLRVKGVKWPTYIYTYTHTTKIVAQTRWQAYMMRFEMAHEHVLEKNFVQ